MDNLDNAVGELYELVCPSHVVVLSVYFAELTNLYHATFSINRKPTGAYQPILGHAVSAASALNAIELAAIEALANFKGKEGER